MTYRVIWPDGIWFGDFKDQMTAVYWSKKIGGTWFRV